VSLTWKPHGFLLHSRTPHRVPGLTFKPYLFCECYYHYSSMSSPLKRKAADDHPKSSPARSTFLPVHNSVPCGDPRCDIPGCLKGPFTTLYYYPPLSSCQIVAEVSTSFLLLHLRVFAQIIPSLTNCFALWTQSFGSFTAQTTSSPFTSTDISSTWC